MIFFVIASAQNMGVKIDRILSTNAFTTFRTTTKIRLR
jgi:hypothetical protein